MHKPICPVCKERPSKFLRGDFRVGAISHTFKFATAEPVFCSKRCAAAYGLLIAGEGGENSLTWCEVHGQWYDNNGCYDCPGYSGIDDDDEDEHAA